MIKDVENIYEQCGAHLQLRKEIAAISMRKSFYNTPTFT
jgi:hypothetical protein